MATKIINVLRDDKSEDILRIFRETPAEEVIFVLPYKCKAFSDDGHFIDLASEASEHGKTASVLTANAEIADLALKNGIGVLESEKRQKRQAEKATPKLAVAHDDEEEEESDEEYDRQSGPTFDSSSTDDDDMSTSDETMTYEGDEDEHDDLDNVEDDLDDKDDDNDITEDNDADEDNIDEDEEVSADFSSQEMETDPEPYYAQLTEAVKKVRPMNDIMKPRQEDQVSVKVPQKQEKHVEVNINTKTQTQIKQDLPPKKIDDLQSMWQAPNSRNAGSSPRMSRKFSVGGGFSKKAMAVLGLIVIAVFGAVLYMTTGSAKVIIKPRISELDFSLKVSVSDKFLTIDTESRMIPGQLFSIEKNIEDSFPASGERDVAQKARGTLIVYNEYGTTPQTLIATTRFKSATGLIFRTLNTITIPGTTVKNGEITPGKIEVEVIADKAGDDYNVPPGKFTIAAFEERGDTDRYEKFYGIAEDSMKGGVVGRAKVVTESDYAGAKQAIEERVLEEAKEELNVQAAGLNILSLFNPTIKEIKANAEIDEATDDFVVSGIAELETMGFMEEDLNILISEYVDEKNNLAVLPEKLELSFENVKFDSENKVMEFTVFVRGPAYDKIDEAKIITDLLGKNEDEITDYIKGLNNVSSARVVLSPFWVFSVPDRADRVSTEIDYE